MSDTTYQKTKKNGSRPKAKDKGNYSGLQKSYHKSKKVAVQLATRPMF